MVVSGTDDYTSEEFDQILADIKDSLPNGASLHTLLITHGQKLVKEIERLRAEVGDLDSEVNELRRRFC